MLALAAITAGRPLNDTAAANTSDIYGKCPDPSACYVDMVRPACADGDVCSKQLYKVVACAWACAPDAKLPEGCRQRCKPCTGKPRCDRMCRCEIECSAAGPCSAQ